MTREPELNSVDRYVKASPRYVLEEHGHCEVPAGCGGVVLQWRDRFTAVPVQVTFGLVGAGTFGVRIDGKAPRITRPQLAPGSHVLVIAVDDVHYGEFAFYAWVASPDVEDPLLWTAGPPGTWLWSATEPDPDDVTDPAKEPDPRRWAACESTEVTDEHRDVWSLRRVRELGATPLTAGGPSSTSVWLRAVFTIPAAR